MRIEPRRIEARALPRWGRQAARLGARAAAGYLPLAIPMLAGVYWLQRLGSVGAGVSLFFVMWLYLHAATSMHAAATYQSVRAILPRTVFLARETSRLTLLALELPHIQLLALVALLVHLVDGLTVAVDLGFPPATPAMLLAAYAALLGAGIGVDGGMARVLLRSLGADADAAVRLTHRGVGLNHAILFPLAISGQALAAGAALLNAPVVVSGSLLVVYPVISYLAFRDVYLQLDEGLTAGVPALG